MDAEGLRRRHVPNLELIDAGRVPPPVHRYHVRPVLGQREVTVLPHRHGRLQVRAVRPRKAPAHVPLVGRRHEPLHVHVHQLPGTPGHRVPVHHPRRLDPSRTRRVCITNPTIRHQVPDLDFKRLRRRHIPNLELIDAGRVPPPVHRYHIRPVHRQRDVTVLPHRHGRLQVRAVRPRKAPAHVPLVGRRHEPLHVHVHQLPGTPGHRVPVHHPRRLDPSRTRRVCITNPTIRHQVPDLDAEGLRRRHVPQLELVCPGRAPPPVNRHHVRPLSRQREIAVVPHGHVLCEVGPVGSRKAPSHVPSIARRHKPLHVHVHQLPGASGKGVNIGLPWLADVPNTRHEGIIDPAVAHHVADRQQVGFADLDLEMLDDVGSSVRDKYLHQIAAGSLGIRWRPRQNVAVQCQSRRSFNDSECERLRWHVAIHGLQHHAKRDFLPDHNVAKIRELRRRVAVDATIRHQRARLRAVDQCARAIGLDRVPLHVRTAPALHPNEPEGIDARLRHLEGERRLRAATAPVKLPKSHLDRAPHTAHRHPEAVVARHPHRVNPRRRKLDIGHRLACDVVGAAGRAGNPRDQKVRHPHRTRRATAEKPDGRRRLLKVHRADAKAPVHLAGRVMDRRPQQPLQLILQEAQPILTARGQLMRPPGHAPVRAGP